MKKMMSIIVCLCVVIPAMAMEVQKTKKGKKGQAPLIITPEENDVFISRLSGAVGFGRTVTDVAYVPQNNPIYVMFQQLSADLKQSDADVLRMIKTKGLEQRINVYKKSADSNKIVKLCLQQIRKKQGDISEAQELAIRTRRILAEKKLQKMRPQYSGQYIGAIHTQSKIEYMERNVNYPMDEDAVKDFIALFIYQIIFAHQTH
jgi:hypothetical protein